MTSKAANSIDGKVTNHREAVTPDGNGRGFTELAGTLAIDDGYSFSSAGGVGTFGDF